MITSTLDESKTLAQKEKNRLKQKAYRLRQKANGKSDKRVRVRKDKQDNKTRPIKSRLPLIKASQEDCAGKKLYNETEKIFKQRYETKLKAYKDLQALNLPRKAKDSESKLI